MAELPTPLAALPAPGSYDHPGGEEERAKAEALVLRRRRFREVESALMSTQDGREWVWAVLNDLHTFERRMSMTGSEFENGFWSGKQEAGIALLQRFVRSDPGAFARMFAEQDAG